MKKVFFSASVYATEELYNNYINIVERIKGGLGNIQENWLEEITAVMEKEKARGGSGTELNEKVFDKIKKTIDPVEFFSDHVKAIDNSDVIIAEISQRSIGVGYQIFYASTKKKPILVLYSPKLADKEYIKTISNINSPFIAVKKYTKKTLPHLVANFLKGKDKILRKFNFIISKEVEDYLEWLCKKNPNKSKSELLRNKLEDELIINDEDYIDYLGSNNQ